MGRHPRPGSVLVGKYQIEDVIAKGGMATVFKARHLGLDEPVAIKVLLPELMAREDIVQRFLREAKSAVKLKGEHIARVLDVGTLEDELPYIVMEYLEGADLGAIIKHQGAVDAPAAVDLILEACEAIAEAHSLGIIHRDIKSANFFVCQPPGHEPMLKVLDFGIATAPEAVASELTQPKQVIGTPAYMAPEQMRASREVDTRSDIWSIGVVLYELLEGARPFRSEVYSDLCLQIGMDPPHPFTQPTVDSGLREVVLRCLEKDAARRYPNIAALAGDLIPYASDHVRARAAFDQCARLLARRSLQMAAQRPIDDEEEPVTTIAPPRRTPAAGVAPVARPTPRPTPQPRTPTSINQGSAESYGDVPRLRPRFGVIAFAALVALGLGGAALYATGYSPFGHTTAQPAAQPQPPPPAQPPPAPAPPPPPAPEVKSSHPAVPPAKQGAKSVKPKPPR